MEKSYIQIPLRGIVAETVPDFDLYIFQAGSYVLYRKAHYCFDHDTLAKLVDSCVESLFIAKPDLSLYEDYRQRVLDGQPGKSGVLSYEGLFVDPDEVRKYYQIVDNFFSVEDESFIDGLEVDFPVFHHQGNDVFILPVFAGKEQGPWVLSPWALPADGELMIKKEDLPRYQAFLENKLVASATGETPVKRKAVLLREMSKLLVQGLLEDPSSSEAMKKLSNQITEVVGFILDNEEGFYGLMRIQAHDFYTYVHSMNVCTLSVALGYTIGLFKSPDLEMLALGGLLHDIGKCRIDPKIIHKPGKLSLNEFIKVKNHVKFGIEMLKESHDLPAEVLQVVAMHHERLSGGGYPLGLRNGQISLFGKIAAIVDAFDSLTADRPYKKGISPFQALDVLSKTTTDYDMDLMRRFIFLLGRQLGSPQNQHN